MGLIGLLVSVVIMVLGTSYYFFSLPGKTVTLTNESLPVAEEQILLDQVQAQALAAKETIENKTAAAAGNGGAPTPSVVPSVPLEKKHPDGKGAGTMDIVNRLMKTGFAVPTKARTIDTLVLHSSYNPNGGDPYSVSALVKIYESYGVSAHYLIDRDGIVYRLVADRNIAYHAGVSQMADGRKNVNDFSIGIEMMNEEDTEYTKAQYAAVNSLVATLKKQYPITSVVGHDDIAPGRKTDPWNFDWKKLNG